MSSSPTPTALEKLGKRPFSFYPPVLNIEHNEWLFERATWSEVLDVMKALGYRKVAPPQGLR